MPTMINPTTLAHQTHELRHDISTENDSKVTEVDALLAVAVAIHHLSAEIRQAAQLLMYARERQ